NEFEAAAALTPLDAELQLDLGDTLAALGDTAGAAVAYQKAGTLAPTWGRPHHRLGRLREREGKLSEAIAAFEAAAQRDPQNTQPLAALAELYIAQNKRPAALGVYRRIVAIEESPAGKVRALDQMTEPRPAL